jgi:hypothetical protein
LLPAFSSPDLGGVGRERFFLAPPAWQGSCDALRGSTGLALTAASLDHFGARNETPASFWERDPSERSVAETLIADINRIVHILDGDIAAEEKRAREIDRPQVEYPMLARTIASRRDNLLNTIGALEERLGKLNQAEQELA